MRSSLTMRGAVRRAGWTAAAALAVLLSAGAASAQRVDSAAAARRIAGVARTVDGRPLESVNVFVLETLDGAVTGADGRFTVVTDAPGELTLVARRIGYRELRRALPAAAAADDVVVVLAGGGQRLAAVHVESGRYTAGEERGATLTPLEVVTTPGTAADVNRAIQLLPGVQPVDEGTGLFVRGGDHTETRVFLNGAALPSTVQLQRHTGTFAGAVNPFLLDGISFSSGGFGARYGDVLSAVADLRTQGRPARASGTLSAGLAALSAAGALPLPGGAGARGAANRFDLAPLLRVNGNPRAYAPPPHGADLSGSAHLRRDALGTLKLFAIRQTSGFALGVEEASFGGSYAADVASDLAVLRWEHVVGRLAPAVSASRTGLERHERYGAFALDTRQRGARLAAQLDWARWDRLTLRGGAELERLAVRFDGTVPRRADDPGDAARTRVLGSTVRGTRDALFGEADWRPVLPLRLVAGARTDRSTLTGHRTVDPRLSAALAVRPGATLTAAWGVYHQVPDALLYAPVLGDPGLPPMRAVHAVVGMQVGDAERALARLELYDKRYRDLAQQTRDYDVVRGGTGHARGADLFLKGALALGVAGRLTYSYVDTERTDPLTGRPARAPYDVTHALAVVAERRWGARWQGAVAWRAATGRPFTPVVGATLDSARRVWRPHYGAPQSERLPALTRLDVTASYLFRPAPALQGVAFAGLTNALDRENVHAWRYTADYGERHPVRSIFNRALYLGASLTRF